jgi:hypothetical protein
MLVSSNNGTALIRVGPLLSIMRVTVTINVMMIFTNCGIVASKTMEPIVMSGSLSANVITASDNIVLTVNLKNNGELLAKSLDVQVVSTGFTVLSQKNWPTNIYPNSSLTGKYILQPRGTGTFPIYVTSTYTLNNTSLRPPKIEQTVSELQLNDVTVQSDLLLSWSNAWNTIVTTLLGTVVGFIITKISDSLTARRIEDANKREKSNLAKSLVSLFLETNKKLVKEELPPEFGVSWDSLGNQSVFHIIPSEIRDKIGTLYIKLRDYQSKTIAERRASKDELCTEITQIINMMDTWTI